MLKSSWVLNWTDQTEELRQGQDRQEAGRGEEAGKWQGSVLGQFMEGVVGHLKGLNLKPEATES